MLKERKELEENLIQTIESTKLKSKKKVVEDIKLNLRQYDIVDVQSWINEPEKEVSELDIRELFLLTEQVCANTKTGMANLIKPEDYFTKAEIRESKQFSGSIEREQEKVIFPYTIPNAQIVGNNAYMVVLDIQTMNQLVEGQLLFYDFDLQREATIKKRGQKVFIEPKIYRKNVNEITQHLLEGTLIPTVHVWNAQIGTADDGDELKFNARKQELIISSGTKMAIVDGMHRMKGLQNALSINPDLQFYFPILITNYSKTSSEIPVAIGTGKSYI